MSKICVCPRCNKEWVNRSAYQFVHCVTCSNELGFSETINTNPNINKVVIKVIDNVVQLKKFLEKIL